MIKSYDYKSSFMDQKQMITLFLFNLILVKSLSNKKLFLKLNKT